jgi:hypothetical protein
LRSHIIYSQLKGASFGFLRAAVQTAGSYGFQPISVAKKNTFEDYQFSLVLD